METITIRFRGEAATLTWNGAEASAPIVVNGDATQYSTGHARHRTYLAVVLACRLLWPEAAWPFVPATGRAPTTDDCEGFEAWQEVSYESAADGAS